jgi:SAM-dependent methyltransferase
VVWEERVYREGQQFNHWPFSPLIPAIKRAVGGREPASLRVLELGCGAGNNLRMLAEEGIESVGIEASMTASRYAHDRLLALKLEAQIVCGDCMHLPFAAGSFDLIVDRACLVHLPFTRAVEVIGHCSRLLRPRGTLISLGFKSRRHPQAETGIEVDHWSRSHLTEGPLAVADVTCFLDPEVLEQAFSPFDSLDWTLHTISDRSRTIVDQQYLVEACRA